MKRAMIVFAVLVAFLVVGLTAQARPKPVLPYTQKVISCKSIDVTYRPFYEVEITETRIMRMPNPIINRFAKIKKTIDLAGQNVVTTRSRVNGTLTSHEFNMKTDNGVYLEGRLVNSAGGGRGTIDEDGSKYELTCVFHNYIPRKLPVMGIGTFTMAKKPFANLGHCTPVVSLVLDKAKISGDLALMSNSMHGMCPMLIMQISNDRTYRVQSVRRGACGSMQYKGSYQDARGVFHTVDITDHRTRTCKDIQKAEIVMTETANGRSSVWYSQPERLYYPMKK
jgi:hypothetical protein